jgi:hypothetical protein
MPILKGPRLQDKEIDFKVAALLYHNDEITSAEKVPRANTLESTQLRRAVDVAKQARLDPVSWSWDWEDIPDEMWDSMVVNSPKAQEAIKDVPKRHLE